MIPIATREERRKYFKESPARAILLEYLIPDTVAARLRDAVRPLLRPYCIADRGRLHFDETYFDADLCYGLAALASETAEVGLTVVRTRWTRLQRGDYAMYKHDHRLWQGMDRHLEVVLDFSAEALTNDADVVYTTPSEVLWMPHRPLSGALIDRRQEIHRYDRYLTHRVGEAEVFRLSLALEVG